MAVTKKWDGIGATNGSMTVSSAGSGDNVFSAVTTGLTVSNGSIVVPAVTNTATTYVRWNDLSLSTWATRCYIQFDGDANGIAHVIYAWGTTNARIWSVSLNTSRLIQLRNAAGSAIGTGYTITLGIKYRFEIRGQSGTDSVTFKVFNASEVEVHTFTSAIGTTLGLLHVQYGRQQSSVQFGPASYSNLQINNTNATIGAYTTPPPVVAPWVVLNSNGTTTALTLNGMWNGSTIVPLDLGQVTPIDTTPPPPPTAYRMPYLQPFGPTAMSNTAIGANATFEANTAGTRTRRLINSGLGTALNSASWSYSIYQATMSDPLISMWRVSSDYRTTKPAAKVAGTNVNIRIPANAVVDTNTDHPMLVVQPDGFTGYELYKFEWASASVSAHVTGSEAYSTYINTNLINTDTPEAGLAKGSRASGISAYIGMIRTEEAINAHNKVANAIPHVLLMGVPATHLNSQATSADGQVVNISQTVNGVTSSYKGVWPTRLIDTQQGSNVYANAAGNVAMGSMWGLPPSVDINALGLSPEGHALAQAFRDYGGYVLIQSGGVTLYGEFDGAGTSPVSTYFSAMNTAWDTIFPLLCRITNNTSTTVGGGGLPRRQPDSFPLTLTNPNTAPLPLNDIVCWGDSLTQSTGSDWPGVTLKNAIDLTGNVTNLGVSGQAAMDIALRQGGISPSITLAGGSIPAGVTPVAVSAISPSTGWRINGTSGTFQFNGTLAGIPGKLSHDIVNSPFNWTFTRTTAGVLTSCPPQTKFISNSLLTNHQRMISVFWTGRNNVGQATTISDILAATAGMVAHLTPVTKRFIVLGVTNTTGELNNGNANYNTIVSLNNQLASLYPDNFFDIRSYLISDGLADAGKTPTSQDQTDIANDTIPTSLRKVGDNTHLNAAGYAVVGNAVADFIKAKRWI